MYSIPIFYGLLVFLDGGTLIEDEDESFYEERIYCSTCQLYKNISTKHCSFCNKCCRKFDHHCSVFGKCIGKKNILIFYAMLFCTGATFTLYFLAGLSQIAVRK